MAKSNNLHSLIIYCDVGKNIGVIGSH